ncbi:MAG TPA: MFS transporter [Candidatus Sulfomarinibacteraceae bacterium]|nr:MFS transporter [Candidatus Sulfomarinibacteraceae bacterium]
MTGGATADADPAAGAVEETGPQPSKVVIVGAAHAAHDTYSAFLPPMLPVLVERLSLVKAEAGLLTVFLQAPSILQPWIGHLGDRLDLRAAVILSPAVTAVGMSLLGVAPGFATVALLLVIAGASSAVLHSVGPVLAGRLSGRRLGWGMGFWMVGGELGRTLGPILLVSAIALLGVRGLPWLMVGGIAASAVLAFSLRGVTPPSPTSERPEGFVRAFRSLRPLLVPLSGVVISRSFMMAAATIYLPLFLKEEGSSLWLAGASLSILEAAGVAGALLGGSASDVFGRRWVLAASFLAAPPLMVGLVFAGGWARVPLLLALGLFGLMATPVVMAVVQEASPGNRALANGVYMALSFGFRSIVIVLVGVLADLIGMRQAFLACAGLSLLGLPFVLRLPGGSGSG